MCLVEQGDEFEARVCGVSEEEHVRDVGTNIVPRAQIAREVSGGVPHGRIRELVGQCTAQPQGTQEQGEDVQGTAHVARKQSICFECWLLAGPSA